MSDNEMRHVIFKLTLSKKLNTAAGRIPGAVTLAKPVSEAQREGTAPEQSSAFRMANINAASIKELAQRHRDAKMITRAFVEQGRAQEHDWDESGTRFMPEATSEG